MVNLRETGSDPFFRVSERNRLASVWSRSDDGNFAEAAESQPVRAAPRPTPLRSILVPVDGTPAAEHALPCAMALARLSGAEVTLINVYSALQSARAPERLGWRGELFTEPLREYVNELAERLSESHAVRVRPLLVNGYRPADTLRETAEWGDFIAPSLIVMGSRHRGWWSRLWRGSVSAEVAGLSRSPVLLVPARDESPDLSAVPTLGRVLVPLDGSARAERALGPAAALAAVTGGKCDLLYVARSRPYAVDWSLAYGGPRSSALADPTREAGRYLSGVADRLRTCAVPTRWRVVTDPRPSVEAIARHARLAGADVIAMTNRGGGGLAGFSRENLAVRTARLTPVPVLISR